MAQTDAPSEAEDSGAQGLGPELGGVIHQAAALKDAQQQQLQRRFASWPRYFQSTMFFPQEFLSIQNAPYEVRMKNATLIKTDGNEQFKKGDYAQAYSKYEMALGIFRFCVNRNQNWRNEGIKDDDIQAFDIQGDTDKQKEEIKSFKQSCYLNIAAAGLKLGDHITAIRACSEALMFDPENVKALYRRAQALMAVPSAGEEEIQMALQDLKKALEINPNEASVRKELNRVLEEQAKQKEQEKKTFSGMFERGQVVDDKSEAQTGEKKNSQEVEQQLNDAQALARQLQEQGKSADAAHLLRLIAQYKKESGSSKEGPRREGSEDTLLKPTPEMVADAAKNGVDFKDPRVLAYWIRLNKSRGAVEGKEDQKDSSQSEKEQDVIEKEEEEAAEMEYEKEDLEDALSQLSDADVARFCMKESIPFEDCADSQQLRERVLVACGPPDLSLQSLPSSRSWADLLLLAVVALLAAIIAGMILKS